MPFSTVPPEAVASPAAAARARRLVDAARVLADAAGNASFTVAQVAAAAGSSLKGFYACFAGKDDLLLALLEDDSRTGAQLLVAAVEAHDEPAARLHAYVNGIFGLLTTPGALGYAGVLVREHQRLTETRPDALERALAPLVDVLVAEIERAHAAGLITVDDARRAAHTVFTLVLSDIHQVTLGRAEPLEVAGHVWRFAWRGLGGGADPRSRP
jgi:AcrR family transcriptional regulator